MPASLASLFGFTFFQPMKWIDSTTGRSTTSSVMITPPPGTCCRGSGWTCTNQFLAVSLRMSCSKTAWSNGRPMRVPMLASTLSREIVRLPLTTMSITFSCAGRTASAGVGGGRGVAGCVGTGRRLWG